MKKLLLILTLISPALHAMDMRDDPKKLEEGAKPPTVEEVEKRLREKAKRKSYEDAERREATISGLTLAACCCIQYWSFQLDHPHKQC